MKNIRINRGEVAIHVYKRLVEIGEDFYATTCYRPQLIEKLLERKKKKVEEARALAEGVDSEYIKLELSIIEGLYKQLQAKSRYVLQSPKFSSQMLRCGDAYILRKAWVGDEFGPLFPDATVYKQPCVQEGQDSAEHFTTQDNAIFSYVKAVSLAEELERRGYGIFDRKEINEKDGFVASLIGFIDFYKKEKLRCPTVEAVLDSIESRVQEMSKRMALIRLT